MEYITTSEISKETGVNYKTCFKVLDALARKKYLKIRYISICPKCHTMYKEYESLNDIPNNFSCEKCKENIMDIFSNTYITFSKW